MDFAAIQLARAATCRTRMREESSRDILAEDGEGRRDGRANEPPSRAHFRPTGSARDGPVWSPREGRDQQVQRWRSEARDVRAG